MSLPRNFTEYIWVNQSLTALVGTLTSEWFDADDLNGAQFFIEYAGTATVNLTAECTAIGGAQKRIQSRVDWSKDYTVKNGCANAEGFVAVPALPFDRPFGGYRVKLTTDADITGLRVAVCRNVGS